MSDIRELVDLLERTESLAIVCHDNPDPDCLASALALRTVAESAGLADSDIVYGGEITHQQNRTFVNLLDIDLDTFTEFDASEWDLVAFVDHAESATNTAFPPDRAVDIVIDHHPRDGPVQATFVDVRPGYGATSTILVEYLQQLGIDPSTELASALLFALHRERIDYMRYPTAHEYEAALFLFPMVDLELLRRIYSSAFSTNTIDSIGDAIEHREIRGGTLVTSVGRTTERDALPQAAEFLLNLEGVVTVLVSGISGDSLVLSARTADPRVNVGSVLKDAFGGVGSAGGHRDMAAGQIPLGILGDPAPDEEDLMQFLSARVNRRFFDSMNLDGEHGSD